MKPCGAGNTILCGESERDHAYVQDVSEMVFAGYTGHGAHWQLVDSDQMWQMSFGGRAGVLGVKLNGRTGCVKLFYDERLRDRLRVRLGFSKGRRAYRNGVRLRRLGVNCPQMWGYAERRPSGPSMIVTELIDDGMRLDHWVSAHGASRGMILALARFVRGMHDRGVSHIDLSPRNILVRPRGEDLDFLLLDYEDARFAARVGTRIRLENLHHLHERMIRFAPVQDRLRFLREYTPQDYRPWRDALRRMLGERQ
jgi:tRNA A-37 threonylcarbamoyl transferase component Bud32